jgi:regulator of replication initiation timing
MLGASFMTENLLVKLEEKMIMLIAEVEDLRKQVQYLMHENNTLKSEKANHIQKLHDLIGLIDTIPSSMDEQSDLPDSTKRSSIAA